VRRTVACLALLALALPGTAARADTPPPPLPGDCGLQTVQSQPIDGDTWHGVLYGGPVAAADLPPDDALDNPVTVTLTCSIRGYTEAEGEHDLGVEASASGVGVAVLPPTPVTVTAGDDVWGMWACTKATLTDARGSTATYYRGPSSAEWTTYDYCSTVLCDAPFSAQCSGTIALAEWAEENVWLVGAASDSVCEALGAAPGCDYETAVWDWLNDRVFAPLDGTICARLVALAPGVPGVVDIDPTGDTSVAGSPFWDCPPYTA
jgi:hypothetical protein